MDSAEFQHLSTNLHNAALNRQKNKGLFIPCVCLCYICATKNLTFLASVRYYAYGTRDLLERVAGCSKTSKLPDEFLWRTQLRAHWFLGQYFSID
jgi:hypothetical protein